MPYAVSDTATVMVDHAALSEMLSLCSAPEARVALIGFNEYSKHLLNLAAKNIVCIYDEREWMHGVRFRERVVVDNQARFDINRIVVCEYSQLYGFAGKIRRLYDNKIKVEYTHRLHYIDTTEINIFKQEAAFGNIDLKSPEAPPSMMDEKKLQFLAELMRAGLKNKGDIIEMGVYQAGSVWYLAHVLQNLGEQRRIHMVDVFEQHMLHPNATMCNDEITKRLAFYGDCVLYEGLVDDENILARIGNGPICFAHYDLGYHPKALEFIWNNLQPGSPVILDNYGHIAIAPWDLDDFFAARGAHVIRNPWSEQGVVFKK